ncbi:hypothetical protein TrVFT333_007083 [Trichoderma virens FT-333]|nr:hypothetical protein TrVFT333_007083 [Trichoderma virens FT-333]
MGVQRTEAAPLRPYLARRSKNRSTTVAPTDILTDVPEQPLYSFSTLNKFVQGALRIEPVVLAPIPSKGFLRVSDGFQACIPIIEIRNLVNVMRWLITLSVFHV